MALSNRSLSDEPLLFGSFVSSRLCKFLKLPQSVLLGKTVGAFFERIEAIDPCSHNRPSTVNHGMPDEA